MLLNPVKALMAMQEKHVSLKRKKQIAELLKVDANALAEFEKAYSKMALEPPVDSDNLFDYNAKQAAAQNPQPAINVDTEDIIERIIAELVSQTKRTHFSSDGQVSVVDMVGEYHGREIQKDEQLVTGEEVNKLPEQVRPQLTGHLMHVDIDAPGYQMVLGYYVEYLKNPDSPAGKLAYNRFLQGLDILDLDSILYQVIGMNSNSIGHWLPQLCEGIATQSFFRIPETTTITVPLSLLQLTRQPYGALTETTLAIIDRYCEEVFSLDTNKDYFVKTGTYSSKYDFRNCHVKGAKEVKELGEYLLFIHFQALQMASPLSKPTIVGACTTNEWVVRDFIQDKDNAPTIYKGMPLHTEYRVFVDMDTNSVMGISPYWEPSVMEHRFSMCDDADSPHQTHDYIVYRMHKDNLMARYEQNKNLVISKIGEMLPFINLHGQWSIDVMQNGTDFYIIDMALAANSALLQCVPKNTLKPSRIDWVPQLEKTEVEK